MCFVSFVVTLRFRSYPPRTLRRNSDGVVPVTDLNAFEKWKTSLNSSSSASCFSVRSPW